MFFVLLVTGILAPVTENLFLVTGNLFLVTGNLYPVTEIKKKHLVPQDIFPVKENLLLQEIYLLIL